MAWDFETDPEFEAQLQWMRDFIDAELIPLEPIFRELSPAEWAPVKLYLQEQVKAPTRRVIIADSFRYPPT